MKFIERAEIQLRARWRVVRAMRGLAGGWPARLLIRLDDLDAPDAGTGLAMAAAAETVRQPPASGNFKTAPGKWRIHRREEGWQDLIVRIYSGAGVVPTRFVGRPGAPFLVPLVRFAHRLEAPTSLRTCGRGMTARLAEELVDAGLEEVWVRLAGLSGELQRAACGEEVEEAQAAIRMLMAARSGLGKGMRVGVEVPFRAEGAREIAGVFRWAQEAGADMCRVAVPFTGGRWEPQQAVMLDLLSLYRPPFNRTSPEALMALRRMSGAAATGAPGAERRSGSCPVGGLQWEVLPDMRLRSCPFKAGSAGIDAGAAEVSGQLVQHRAAIRACRRECHHPDLAV